MADFLAENNTCGQNILRLVSRGNAIIAEILRLKDFIPQIYRLDNKSDQQKYGDLILDFSYFKTSDIFEQKVDNDRKLQDLDEEIRENNLDIITRFYLAFESIHKYVIDLNRFLEDLEEGLYIQQTLESVLESEEGKQLLCEALYLYGVMLLVVDLHIKGIIRERILVSYYRYSAQRSNSESNIDDVCKLLRSTGFPKPTGGKKAFQYPEEYFKRIPIQETYIDMVLGRLRSDDVYHQLKVFGLPEHRSTAFGNQAAMLVICLFFSPSILHYQTAVMREIVDKYFPDNWVINIYMGEILNLIDAWEPYKAAKSALSNSLEPQNLSEYSKKHRIKFQKLLPSIQNLVQEGALTEDQILDNSQKVINLIREANVTLRWLMLHTAPLSSATEGNKKCKQVRDCILSETKFSHLEMFQLLLNSAQFELKVKDMFKAVEYIIILFPHLLSEKQTKWEGYKRDSVDRMNELSDVFSGTKPLTRVEKNENLHKWFQDIGKQIDSLNHEETTVSGRKIVQLIKALEEVQEFHGIGNQIQVSQFLLETRNILHSMLRSINIKEEVSIHLQVIADMSYAWHIMDSYTTYMQKGIKEDPSLVVKLRATFLKMASALEIPLLRINQARSPDLVSVSQYYSNELVAYLRKVLHIIPETMFEIMAKIAQLQTYEIKEVPTRLDKDQLKEFAQLDNRFEVAKLTHAVSVLTEGITMMKSTLVGVIRIDPIQLLEDGIRKELVKHMATALNNGLSFNTKSKTSELIQKLETLGDVMDGHKRSFEYIQDYIHIYGLKIWQEELTRVIGYNVEQECNNFLRNKISDWQSRYQSKTIPIPKFLPQDTTSVNFMGRLARELIKVTDPKTTIYLEQTVSWYDLKTKAEVINTKSFSKITKSVGTQGVTGLDCLLSFIISSDLQNFLGNLENGILKEKAWVQLFEEVFKVLENKNELIKNSSRCISYYTSSISKIWPQILDCILKIGQMQLLRILIAYELSTCCKSYSPNFVSVIEAFNKALLSDIKKHYRDPSKPYPSDNTFLLESLASQLDAVGLSDPVMKIYVTTKNLNNFAVLAFLFTLSHISKLHYSKTVGALLSKKTTDPLDGISFTMGLQTVFRQFHPSVREDFLSYMALYLKSIIVDNCQKPKAEVTEEILTTIYFLDSFVRIAKLPKDTLSEYIPQVVLDLYPMVY
ncbi:hypothetical protein RUM43_001868 [Polyplax serrata]|uniref:WASH complex subunit strumpellin n=1 Tax=Polyplax serrata TaxID=468196 RepID=A0AAN8SEH6_POLSC